MQKMAARISKGKVSTMRKVIYECDCCGRLVDYDHIIRLKARSGSFVTYATQDIAFADRRNYDVCKDCLDHIDLCSKRVVDSNGRSVNRKSDRFSETMKDLNTDASGDIRLRSNKVNT